MLFFALSFYKKKKDHYGQYCILLLYYLIFAQLCFPDEIWTNTWSLVFVTLVWCWHIRILIGWLLWHFPYFMGSLCLVKEDCPWIPPLLVPRKVLIKVSVASLVSVVLSCWGRAQQGAIFYWFGIWSSGGWQTLEDVSVNSSGHRSCHSPA